MQEICNNVRNMVKQITDLHTDEFENNASLMEIGFASNSYIKLVVMLEDFYDIEFDDDDLIFSNFISISKIAELVDKHLKEKAK